MKKSLFVMLGIFVTVCNSANSKTEDCIALCNQCVEVSDTIAHMGCTKHCEELMEKDHGKMTCSKLTALNKDIPSVEDEINAFHARISELVESSDVSAIVEELYTDDSIGVINGQAPLWGKEDFEQAWSDWFESNPSINRLLYTSTAFGKSNGKVWEDGVGNCYHDDVLVGSFRYMYVYKLADEGLLLFMDIEWDKDY
ncbi:uncharacterized protein [Amphiura filiformis]|uniref:uncharacterized protein n=1 Tax=Amphiura filiformis TaxID=82378 RepID=UPI003B2174A0